MRIKNRLSLGLVILLCSLLCACGDDGGGTALILNSTTPTPAPTAAPTPTPKPADNLEPPLVQKWQYLTASTDRLTQPLQLSPDKQTSFLLELAGNRGAEVVALNVATGQVKWRTDVSVIVYDRTQNLRVVSVVDDNLLYLTPFRSMGGIMLALDTATGAKKWDFKLDSSLGFLSENLESQGDSLFVTYETPDVLEVLLDKPRTTYLVSVDKKSGNKNWEFKADNTELVQRVKGTTPGSRLSTSPQLLYLQGVDAVIYGIDPASGKVNWKIDRSTTTNFRMVGAYKDGVLEIVTQPVEPTKWSLRAVSAKDSSTLWELPFTVQNQEIPGQGRFFGDDNTLYLISPRPDMQGGTLYKIDLTKGAVKWSYSDPRITFATGAKESYYLMTNQDYVYGFGIVRPGMFALDADTGKLAWQVDDTNYYGLAATSNTLYSSNTKKLVAFSLTKGTSSGTVDLPPNTHVTYRMQNAGNILLFYLANGMLAYGKA